MSVDKDTFLTSQKRDYKWPYPKPMIAKPPQPPIKTKPLNYFVATHPEPYCHCDAHLYDPQMKRYEKLAEKEKVLSQEFAELYDQMLTLTSEIMDHPCDTDDDKLMTTYQIDYIKRGKYKRGKTTVTSLHVPAYRKLMPAIESPVGVPVKSQSIELADAYRDPTSFRYSTFLRPNIEPCPCVKFDTSPANYDKYFEPLTGRSEYQDTIDKMGLSIIKSRQQYAEPLPSSRRRIADQCL